MAVRCSTDSSDFKIGQLRTTDYEGRGKFDEGWTGASTKKPREIRAVVFTLRF